MAPIGIINSTPWIVNLPGQGGGPTPPTGDFVELEPSSFLMALESGLSNKVELE